MYLKRQLIANICKLSETDFTLSSCFRIFPYYLIEKCAGHFEFTLFICNFCNNLVITSCIELVYFLYK